MNWLITGGYGFIGRNIVRDLVKDGGHSLRIVDNLGVGTRSDLAQICDFTELEASEINFPCCTSVPSMVNLIVGDINCINILSESKNEYKNNGFYQSSIRIRC